MLTMQQPSVIIQPKDKYRRSYLDRFERFSYAIAVISRCWHRLAAEEMYKLHKARKLES